MRKYVDVEQDQLADALEVFQSEWKGPGPAPHVVAHRDPRSKFLSFILRGLPEQFDYLRDMLRERGPAEYQWGVRTVYADDSVGLDWTNEDDARAFLTHYADYDADPIMRVKSRELVKRLVAPGEVTVVDSGYAERRLAAAERRARRLAAAEAPVLPDPDTACAAHDDAHLGRPCPDLTAG